MLLLLLLFANLEWKGTMNNIKSHLIDGPADGAVVVSVDVAFNCLRFLLS